MLTITAPRLTLVEADDELLATLAPLTGDVLTKGSEPFELGAGDRLTAFSQSWRLAGSRCWWCCWC